MDENKEIFTRETEVGAANTVKPRLVPKYLIVIVMILIISCTMVAGIFIGINIYGVSKEGKELMGKMPYLDDIYKLIDEYYYKDIDWSQIQDQTLAGLANLDKFSGISITENIPTPKMGISFIANNYNELFVKKVEENTPAAGALGRIVDAKVNNTTKALTVTPKGLTKDTRIERGDMLYGVKIGDNQYLYLAGVSSNSVMQLLGNIQPGITLVFKKFDGRFIEITINKEFIASAISEYKNCGSGVGYIRLDEFNVEAIDDFYIAADAFIKDTSANKLIFDLRGNGGGNVSMLQMIMPFFMDEINSDIMRIDRKGKSQESFKSVKYTSEGGITQQNFKSVKGANYELVVLTDGGSASASEAFVGAIRYYEAENTTIIGSPTYGKGVAQVTFKVDKYYVSIVNGNFYVPVNTDGKTEWKSYHEIPMVPDYNFENDENYGQLLPNMQDEVDFQKAMEILTK